MARHFQDLHLQAEKLTSRRFFNEKVGLDWFDLELKSKAAKKFRIGNHRRGLRVAPNLATEPPFNLRHVRYVIEVTVCKQQKF